MESEKQPRIGMITGPSCYSWVSGTSACSESESACSVIIKSVEDYTPERAKELGME